MDTRQLKTLIAVAEHGTFAKAAEVVRLTPSAVSQQMQALESEVRAELFDRSKRPITLNSHGLQLLEAAHRLVRVADDVVDTISGRAMGGTFIIGSVRSSALSLLPRALVALKTEFPDLRVKLRVANSDELLSDVASSHLDSAMVAEHPGFPSTLRWSPFLREPLCVIAPAGTRSRSAAEILSTLPYVKFISRFRLAHIIDTELARSSIVPNVIAEIDTIAAVVGCVVHGLGASIVPWNATEDVSAKLVAVPFGDPQIHRLIGLVERRASPRAAVIARLHEHLVSLNGEFGLPR